MQLVLKRPKNERNQFVRFVAMQRKSSVTARSSVARDNPRPSTATGSNAYGTCIHHIPIRTFSATVHSVRLSYMGWALLLLLLRSTQESLCDTLRTLAFLCAAFILYQQHILISGRYCWIITSRRILSQEGYTVDQ